MMDDIKLKAKKLKREIKALYLACKRPDVPLPAKVCAFIVLGYALSPIDLIPDFIPILGYLDDLILIPLGVWLAIKMMPSQILEECRWEAENAMVDDKLTNWTSGVIVIITWIVIVGLIIYVIRT